MKKICIFFITIFLFIFCIFPAATAYALDPSKIPVPSLQPTKVPVPTIIDLVVNIPDAALRTALHTKTGVPLSQEIYRSDLAAITGSLVLNNLGISNAQGIQYCKKIAELWLEGNALGDGDLPSGMSKMTGLKKIWLKGNVFEEFPPQLFSVPNLEYIHIRSNPINTVGEGIAAMAKLKYLNLEYCYLKDFPAAILNMDITELYLKGTPIGELPDEFNKMDKLKKLDLNNTGLKKLPESLYGMTSLEVLDVSNNSIQSLSKSVSGMTSLISLNFNNNALEALPDSICTLPALNFLIVSGNSLYSLPAGIGNSSIKTLDAKNNKISSLPKSIGQSANMYVVDVMLNRLETLPSTFDDKQYEIVNVEFNFLDVSSGSPARKIIDNTTANSGKYFERQLKPIASLTAASAADSVSLTWSAGQNGSASGADWEVKGYAVYQITGSGSTKLADLSAFTLQYTHTGLAPATDYTYRIGIDYNVKYPAFYSGIVTIRAYKEVKATTQGSAAVSQSASSAIPSASAQTTSLTETKEGVQAEKTAPVNNSMNEPATAQNSGLPVWAIVVICVVGAGIIGTGVAIAVIKLKKPGV